MKPNQSAPVEKVYTSAEFRLESPGIFFHFKLRRTESQSLFALVQKHSRALAAIRPGDTIPMTYHFQDRTIPAEIRETRVTFICEGSGSGFGNHVMIGLEMAP